MYAVNCFDTRAHTCYGSTYIRRQKLILNENIYWRGEKGFE